MVFLPLPKLPMKLWVYQTYFMNRWKSLKQGRKPLCQSGACLPPSGRREWYTAAFWERMLTLTTEYKMASSQFTLLIKAHGGRKWWAFLAGDPLALSESESRSVMSHSLRPHGLYSPWKSPGQNSGVGSRCHLQGIFPTQGSNPGLPHCRWILYLALSNSVQMHISTEWTWFL